MVYQVFLQSSRLTTWHVDSCESFFLACTRALCYVTPGAGPVGLTVLKLIAGHVSCHAELPSCKVAIQAKDLVLS